VAPVTPREYREVCAVEKAVWDARRSSDAYNPCKTSAAWRVHLRRLEVQLIKEGVRV